jgi:hypothetical protein
MMLLCLELWELLTKMYFNRRLIIHESIYDKVKDACFAYKQLSIESIRWKQSRWTANRYWRSRNVQLR